MKHRNKFCIWPLFLCQDKKENFTLLLDKNFHFYLILFDCIFFQFTYIIVFKKKQRKCSILHYKLISTMSNKEDQKFINFSEIFS